MVKSIDPIQPVSLVYCTYWMLYAYTHTHTQAHMHSGNPSPDTWLHQQNPIGRPSLKIDMMAIKGGLVEWSAMNNLTVRRSSKERGEACKLMDVFFFHELVFRSLCIASHLKIVHAL